MSKQRALSQVKAAKKKKCVVIAIYENKNEYKNDWIHTAG